MFVALLLAAVVANCEYTETPTRGGLVFSTQNGAFGASYSDSDLVFLIDDCSDSEYICRVGGPLDLAIPRIWPYTGFTWSHHGTKYRLVEVNADGDRRVQVLATDGERAVSYVVDDRRGVLTIILDGAHGASERYDLTGEIGVLARGGSCPVH